ncbi:unnamed protein product [Adineta steineri]|uniref:Uncharacterized protein n=1 Tax=Adineta steineri TaxID=433720 RepID=A0A814C6D8_9BILA|nr:unnamed protein product [Adineta steineri]
MAARDSSTIVDDADRAIEYYEEIDNHKLDFRKRKAPPSKSVTINVREPSPVVDPVRQLNEQLNRQFRPDLVPPTPSPPSTPEELPVIQSVVQRTPSPNPVVYDSRVKPVKPPKEPKEPKEPSISIKEKLRSRIHELTAPTPEPIFYTPEIFDQQTTDEYQALSGFSFVPISQQQQQKFLMATQPSQQQPHISIKARQSQPPQQISMMARPSQPPQKNPMMIRPSQPQESSHPTISHYQPPTIANNISFKNNKVAPPLPSNYNRQMINQNLQYESIGRSSSLMSTNPLIQTSNGYQQQSYNYIDQSKINKRKSKQKSITNSIDPHKSFDRHKSFALYNQQNGRIEGVVKNRLNVAVDNEDGDKIIDDESAPKSKLALWLSQPLCLGLKRLSGGLLFGSMIILGTASFAGLIASIVTYSQDSVTDAQWKILGMVVCTIIIITIIVTLIVFICCYKYGYMFNKDEDVDPDDPSATYDADGNERQKAVLRKIYKFNRPTEGSSIPSGMVQDVSTPGSISYPTVQVTDKQTNTESTIATVRPKDFNRGVWPSMNSYGGIMYRPLIPPDMVSRFIQVLPQDIEESLQVPQIIYQVVAPVKREVQPRIIQIPSQQAPVIEVIETKQPRTRVEYIDVEEQQPEYEIIEEKRPRRIIQQQPEYEIVEEKRPRRVVQQQQPQYEVVEEKRPRRLVQQQSQHEYVEEIANQSESSSIEEFVQVIDAPKQTRQQRRKKDKKQNFGVSVKRIQSNND